MSAGAVWRRTRIAVATMTGPVTISALVLGTLAVHRRQDGRPEAWGITHVPTGARMPWSFKETAPALLCAQAMLSADAGDFESIESEPGASAYRRAVAAWRPILTAAETRGEAGGTDGTPLSGDQDTLHGLRGGGHA